MEKGGWEGGMLLQFCRYHIQNYRSYKQGEQEANLRTNQNSSGGSGKRQEPQGGGVGVGVGGGLLLLALWFNPSHPAVLLDTLTATSLSLWLNLPRCRLEGEDVEVKEQGYLGSSSAVLM